MAKPAARIGLIEAMLVIAALAVVLRAAQLQLIQGGRWQDEAERSRKERQVLPARRGGIYDRNGVPLALTQEYFEVGFAPNELTGGARDVRLIARSLGFPLPQLQRQVATRKWVAIRGPFNGLQVQELRALRGVYLDGQYSRHYPAGPLARGVVGSLTPDSGRGASGVELALDSLLAGVPGEAVVLKDKRGQTYQSPSRIDREPTGGRDVFLTLDAELQEISERALEGAMAEFDAIGGDIVMLDPHTGELLALASRRTVDGQMVVNRATYFTEPFEPGSTAKLFTAGALLTLHRVDSTDRVYAEDGLWKMPVDGRGHTRLIHDAHATPGSLTLADAIRVSSNIAMGKFSQRLSAVEQFEALRDFGFSSPTGVEFPSESRGTLRMPDRWDGYSKPSIAMGYEFEVTPIQLAAAYAAIANQGILLTPTLVREIRSDQGLLLYRHQPEPVRRAISPAVAKRLLEYLRRVVAKGGTAEAAQLANWILVGKTGTVIRHDGGVYQSGHYTASFASVFPLTDPQLVVVVKIDDPRSGKIYGGETAAPLTRAMLEEALSARRSALDRSRLASPALEEAAAVVDDNPDQPAVNRVVLTLPVSSDSAARPGPRLVPNVTGSSLRRAANALHRRGFHVAVRGSGRVQRTTPAAGDSAGYGALVTVWAE
ncbi:MAG TPA: penicillin-binding transpeptidase domain-containing protein [Gemmatimonadales bacterium]|jgi:cell division protein FtsI (penicillin-binding protein 3)